ncbi:MAG: DNA pilot protein [Microviridae sp.]|nr:MAG: DNA pilot protein [Microviridae sp.]
MDEQKQSALSSIAGSIPVIGGVAQSVINAIQNRSNIDRQNKSNRQLAEYQYSKDLEMWNRGNEYNAPQAQMSRLKSAGLNPNLVYGSGAVAGQSAQSLPKFQAPEQSFSYSPPVDIPAHLGQYQDFRINQAQIDNMKAQRTVQVQMAIGKALENEALGGQVMQEGGDTSMSMIKQLKLAALQKQWQGNEQQRKLFPHQLSMMDAKSRFAENSLQKLSADIAKVQASTELTKLQKEMFMPQFWAKTLTGGVGAIKGLLGLGKVPAKVNSKTLANKPGATTAPWKKLEPGYGLKRKIQYVRPRK